MSSETGTNEKQAEVKQQDLQEVDIQHAETLKNEEFMDEAVGGENREHQLGAWEAAKTHPLVCRSLFGSYVSRVMLV